MSDTKQPDEAADLIEHYEEQCAALAAEEEEFLAGTIPPQDDDSDEPPDSNYIEQCLYNNEMGDGYLYARLNQDQFLYVKKRDKKPWLRWNSHHWEVDVMGQHIRAVEKVAVAYKDEAFALDEPIRKTSADLREAEKRASIAKETEDHQAQAEAEAAVRSHTHQLKLLRSKKDKYLRRVDRLRGKGGAEKTVWWAHHIERPLAITGDEIDQHRMLLAAPNGVIDLYSGDLREGRPSDLLLKTISVKYPVHIDRKRIMRYLDTGQGMPELDDWDRFITQILSHDPAGHDDGSGVPQFFQRLSGYSFMGDKKHHLFVIATGGGRNGKGTYFRTSKGIAGEFYWTVNSDLLLDKNQPRNTSGASPDILMLRGRRMVVASETNQHRHIDCARVKEYSGGDPLNARGLFDGDETNFDPEHLFWMQTNHVPSGVTKDFALRQRAVIIDFPWRYVPDVAQAAKKEQHLAPWFRPMDPDLEKRLAAQRELILLWYLRGAILMQREGPSIPARVRADLDDLQLQEDHIEQHLRTCCLLDWDPDRDYGEGDQVNVPDPDAHVGQVFTSLIRDNRGQHPLREGSSAWEYRGRSGIDTDSYTFFKEYYSHYIKWFVENVNDKKDKHPSSKSVADALRKKGYTLAAPGGQLKILNGGIKVIGVLSA